MNKKNFYVFVVMVLVSLVMFSACGSDDDEDEDNGGGISGYYMSSTYEFAYGTGRYETCSALHFVNGNTVEVYDYVAHGKAWDSPTYSASFGGRSGWYYQTGCNPSYTYVIADGKIYITNGYIFTIIDNNTLRKDGSSDSWTKQ